MTVFATAHEFKGLDTPDKKKFDKKAIGFSDTHIDLFL